MADSQDHVVEEQVPYDLNYPKKSTMEVFNEASLDWKIQIYNEVNFRTGQPRPYPVPAKKIGALPQVTVEEFADIVIQDNDNNPDTAEIVLKASILEHVYLMTGMAMNSTLKEKNLMQSMTRVTDEIIAAVNHSEQEGALAKLSLAGDEYGKFPDGGFKRGELPLVSASTTGKSVADFDGDSTRRVKRKKSKPKSNHLPNMRNSTVKSALGASILGMLGKVQRQHTDTAKHQLLQELPLADLVEVASGEKLPDYQANLLNAMQAKADPKAPIVQQFVEETKKTSQAASAITIEGLTKAHEEFSSEYANGETREVLGADVGRERLYHDAKGITSEGIEFNSPEASKRGENPVFTIYDEVAYFKD